MKKTCFFASCLTVLCGINATANSPYLYKVYDFLPAPGQFVNALPAYEDGDTHADMIAKVEEQLCGDDRPGMISLGAYGGYVVVGFDHPVVNVKGEYDFKIYGNAFLASGSTSGGNSEPGIVMVSVDENGDGIANDTWYELAGSAYGESLKNYQVTYTKPDGLTDIAWTSNDPDEPTGYVERNSFHSQSYWPEWCSDATLTFNGTRVPKNGENQGQNGAQYWVLNCFDWGYVDNRSNDSDPGFKIDWAVDGEGNAVELPKIDFIKIYCGIMQTCGWLGESSTEVAGGVDLHPEATGVNSTIARHSEQVTLLSVATGIIALRNGGDAQPLAVYGIDGRLAANFMLQPGDNTFNLSHLNGGIYIIKTNSQTFKISL